MSLSRVLLVDDDTKSKSTLAFAFEREKVEVAQATSAEALELLTDPGEIRSGDAVVVGMGGADAERALLVVRQIRDAIGPSEKLPVVAVGKPDLRAEALSAGASEFLARPAYVKDVISLARIHTSSKEGARRIFAGELSEYHGLFYLVRAITSACRTGVMTMVRGLRRGELRFYEGEVTSAQVGVLHGLAALQQLLLWGEARFELREEPVVRRQQIPLSPDQVLEDARRYLKDFEEVAQGLRPQVVYEQDLRRVSECVDRIPREVLPLLRLFDGVRTLADVVEDSSFRVVETIKVARRLLDMGAIRQLSEPRPRTDAQAALAITDWVVGGDTPPMGVPVARSPEESDPVGPPPGEPAAPPDAPAADWGALPAAQGSGDASYASVVPARSATGEIGRVAPGEVEEGGRAPSVEVALDEARPEEPSFLKPTNGASQVARELKEPDEPEKKEKESKRSEAPRKRRAPTDGETFDELENQFFQSADKYARPAKVESFEDLDEGRPAPTFWERLKKNPDQT